MKKLFLMIGIGLLMASCKGDYKDWAEPQSNPDEGSKTVTFTAAQAAAIDLAAVEGDSVALFVPTVVVDDAAINSYEVTMTNSEKPDANYIVKADDQGRVAVADLKAGIQNLFGKRPAARTVNLFIAASTNISGQVIKNSAETTATVTVDAKPVSESGYTLVLSDGQNVEFTQMTEGDVYDNAIFRAIFEVAGETSWTIKANDDGSKLGVAEVEEQAYDKDGNPIGDLVAGGKAFTVEAESKYYLYIDMENYTYRQEFAPEYEEYIWQAGNANNWGQPAEPLYSKGGSGEYYGFMYLDGGYKFRSQESSWEAPDWGSDGTEWGLAEFGSDFSAEAGFYRVDLSLVNMNFSLTPITSISIIGTVNGDWNNDTDMTFNKASGAWECMATLNAGEMKFRANHDWTWNWGGTDLSNFTQGGANYNLAEGGTYFIQLFARCDTKAYAVITKQ